MAALMPQFFSSMAGTAISFHVTAIQQGWSVPVLSFNSKGGKPAAGVALVERARLHGQRSTPGRHAERAGGGSRLVARRLNGLRFNGMAKKSRINNGVGVVKSFLRQLWRDVRPCVPGAESRGRSEFIVDP
jgi:hypothetical protein